jgi:methylated-DNA-[protein]-cysteine S-methyltransferase
MTKGKPESDIELEALLRRSDHIVEEEWGGARRSFTARAQSEGLVRVAFEDHDTPLGKLRINATSAGIVRIALPIEGFDGVLEDLAGKISPRILRAGSPTITRARQQLDAYFAGELRMFTLPIDWTLVRAFRRKVLDATARIPYGETSSYRGVATAAGSPNAVRAAGSALARNPLPIVVPCHRVLRSGGALGQYAGGLDAKVQLLTLEKAI